MEDPPGSAGIFFTACSGLADDDVEPLHEHRWRSERLDRRTQEYIPSVFCEFIVLLLLAVNFDAATADMAAMAPGWEEVIAPLMSISSIWAWVFLFYFFFTYFAVLNVATWNAKQRTDGQVACLMVKHEKCLGHVVCNSIRQYRKNNMYIHAHYFFQQKLFAC